MATWTFEVVPFGMPLRDPDMSLGMRLIVFSIETPGSDGSESMAVGLSGPLDQDRETGPVNTTAYVTPFPDGFGCRLPSAAFSLVNFEFAGRRADRPPGAVHLFTRSFESPALAISFDFRLPASWEALVPLPIVVLRLQTGNVGFFLRAIASLNSFRRAGENCKVEIAFIKANSSCLSIILSQDTKGLHLPLPL